MCEVRTITECGKRNNAGMPARKDIVRNWLLTNLEAKGRGSKRALAAFLNLPSQAITRMTNRKPGRESRGITADELIRMAEFFGVPPPFANDQASSAVAPDHVVAVMGYIGAGAEIDPDAEQVPADGLDQVELPFAVPEDMIGFEVRGDSQLPKFSDGDVIVVPREQRHATADLIGEEAAIRTQDGHRYLKRIMPGPRAHTYNLESANARTIVGARVAWASEIWAIVPARRLRHLRARRAKKA